MTKEYNWRTDYDWTDPNDNPVDEATEDCKKIQLVSFDEDSPQHMKELMDYLTKPKTEIKGAN
jgi:hypothetical protein